MTEGHLLQSDVLALTPLSDDEREDAEFRGKDRAWAALVAAFDELRAETGFGYRALGERIGRSRKQVYRWLSAPGNMNLSSFGLLAEGMDADIEINVVMRREAPVLRNHCHPSEMPYRDIVFPLELEGSRYHKQESFGADHFGAKWCLAHDD